ncbi:recombination regulator RecX [Texcoconibacillus texcoconensis]|uniref:Regulatory protein RecX n=1 Tax=Texcoconibacillus texcoconensis TaxID=1095777 RepID=A0A840QSX7_9BACI|nr:regulatory protein [Texcoconibacillus texcoconensis]
MKIAKITTQKKRKDRFNVYIDRGKGEEYAFSVSEDVLVSESILKGMELTEEAVERIQEKEAVNKGYQSVLNYLSYRMRTEKEIIDYLHKKEVPEENVPRIADKLKQQGLIDDQSFSESYIRTKKNEQLKGPMLLKQELERKGVDQHIIEQALTIYSQEEQFDKATQLANKKSQARKNEPLKSRQQKLIQHLIQRGFSQHMSVEVVRDLDWEHDDQLEWQAIEKYGLKALRKYRQFTGWELEQKVKQTLVQRGFSFDLIQQWLDEQEIEK